MQELAKLISKYCSWCEATNCKKNKAKCYKFSKRFLNKKLRKKYKSEIKILERKILERINLCIKLSKQNKI